MVVYEKIYFSGALNRQFWLNFKKVLTDIIKLFTDPLLDKELSSHILNHYDLSKILSFLTADISIAWVLYPIEQFCSRHTFFLWSYMVSRGALQWNIEHKMMLIYLKVPYYRDVILSSNEW